MGVTADVSTGAVLIRPQLIFNRYNNSGISVTRFSADLEALDAYGAKTVVYSWSFEVKPASEFIILQYNLLEFSDDRPKVCDIYATCNMSNA